MACPFYEKSLKLDMLFNLLYEVGFGLCAYHLVYHLAAFDKKDGGYGSDAVVDAQLRVVVNIHLTHVYFAGIFLAQLFNNGPDSAARATPFRPEIYYG